MFQLIATALGVYALIVVALFVFQRNLMYHGGSPAVPVAQSLVPDAEERFVESAPGIDVRSWYLPPKDGKPVIVFFHGNAGTIANRDFKARLWHDAGYGVWLAGCRGFGGNAGNPTEQGLYADGRAVVAALGRAQSLPPWADGTWSARCYPRPVVVWGRLSLVDASEFDVNSIEFH